MMGLRRNLIKGLIRVSWEVGRNIRSEGFDKCMYLFVEWKKKIKESREENILVWIKKI